MTTTRDRWIEVLVVCCIGIAPDVFHSTLCLVRGSLEVDTFRQGATYVLLRAIWVAIPVLWVMRTSGPLREFGMVRPRWSDLVTGIVTAFAYVAVSIMVWPVAADLATRLPGQARPALGSGPQSPFDHVLLVAMAIANGFAEELVVRAHLITRLRELTGPIRALLISTALFAAYHTYQGASVVTTAAGGVVLGVIFLLTRRLWPVAIAHAVLDTGIL